MPRFHSRRLRHRLKSRPVMVATAVVLLITIFAILEVTNITHYFGTKVPAVIPIPPTSATDNPSSPSSSAQNNPPKTSAPKDKETTTSPSNVSTNSDLPLDSPYGQFVSNHAPGSGGSPTTVDSVCSTTPGAKCYIKFTKSDGTTSQLPSQTIGSDGSTRWSSWDSNILSSGSWTVTAVATLGEQTKTTQDPTPLIIE